MRGLRCPRCGSTEVKPKGYAVRKCGTARIFRCCSCNRRFRDNPARGWKSSDLPEDLLERYLIHSLRRLKDEVGGSEISISTLYRAIKHRLRKVSNWRSLLEDGEIRKSWGYIMGIDLTNIKVGGKIFQLLYVVDVPSRLPLAWSILPDKSADSIKQILMEVKRAGYNPKVVITDLASELLKAVAEVFPNALIQGCIFHLLLWLAEGLPMQKRDINPETRHKWAIVKRKILAAALSPTEERRKRELEDLYTLYKDLDERAKSVVLNFISNLKYYHTFQQLGEYGFNVTYLFNNACERAFGDVKSLKLKMRGFRRLANTIKYIDLLFLQKVNENKTQKSEVNGAVNLILKTLITGGILNLRIGEFLNLDIELLSEQAEKCGFIVAAGHAFTKSYVEKLRRLLLRCKPSTLKEAAKLTGLDIDILRELLPKAGFRIKWRSLLEEEITYPSENLDNQ